MCYNVCKKGDCNACTGGLDHCIAMRVDVFAAVVAICLMFNIALVYLRHITRIDTNHSNDIGCQLLVRG